MTDYSTISKRFGVETATIIIVVIAISTVATTAWQPHGLADGQYAYSSASLPPISLTLVGLDSTQIVLNETDIGSLPSLESYGGLKNQLGNIKDLGNYTGVPLSTLCNLVGGINATDSLRITATDSYTITLSYGQVVNGAFITYDNSSGQQVVHNQSLTPILAYYYDDMNVSDGPLKLAIVGPEGLLTDGTLWVKWVVKLEVLPRTYTDDVAATNVMPLKTVVGQTFQCRINLTISNQGGCTEIFNVTLNANSIVVATRRNLVLANATSMAFTCNWDTTGVAYGNYTVWGYIPPVPGETNTTNNNSTGGKITVSIPGDINGDFAVGLSDLGKLAKAYNSHGPDYHYNGEPVSPNWNPNADINNDGTVGLSDLGILAKHYNQHYP